MDRKELVYCENCGEFVRDDSGLECKPLKGNGMKIMPCPCCYGWGLHGERLCTTCNGKRMVIEKIIYERIKDIELK